MKKNILLRLDETLWWRMYDLKAKVSKSIRKNISWEEFIYSAVTGLPIKTTQEMLEEADRITERSLKEHDKS